MVTKAGLTVQATLLFGCLCIFKDVKFCVHCSCIVCSFVFFYPGHGAEIPRHVDESPRRQSPPPCGQVRLQRGVPCKRTKATQPYDSQQEEKSVLNTWFESLDRGHTFPLNRLLYAMYRQILF